MFFVGSARAHESEIITHLHGDLVGSFYDPIEKEWRWQGPAIVGTTALSSYLLFEFVDEKDPDPNREPAFGNLSRWVSGVGGYLPFALPVGFFGTGLLFPKNSVQRTEAFRTGEELAEALLFTYTITHLIKFSVRRNRPDESNRLSFPSGHASFTFSSAGILAYRYPWYVGVPSLAAATAVALTRTDLNKHFFSDISAGAGLGLLLATSVHLFHESHWKRDREKLKKTTQWFPLIDSHTLGLAITAVGY